MPPSNAHQYMRALRASLTIAWYAGIFAGAFIGAMFLSSIGTIDNSYHLVFSQAAIFFGVLGALYGTIIALDPNAPRVLAPGTWVEQIPAPVTRTLMCAAFGTAAVAVVHSASPTSFGSMWLLLGTAIGGALGWHGWGWAKHIDF